MNLYLMDKVTDLYQVLGLSRTATKAEIKSAFRKMAHKWHPDTNKGDKTAEEKFKEIYEAYDVLKDDFKRKLHDSELKEIEATSKVKKTDIKTKNETREYVYTYISNQMTFEYKFFSILVSIFSISLMFVLLILVAARNKDHPMMRDVIKVFKDMDKEKVQIVFDKAIVLHQKLEDKIFKKNTSKKTNEEESKNINLEIDNPFKNHSEETNDSKKEEKKSADAKRENNRVRIELIDKTYDIKNPTKDEKEKPKERIIYTKGSVKSGKDLIYSK